MAETDKSSPSERKARREERRAKQRAGNLLRAKKMHAARLMDKRSGLHAASITPPDITVDHSLPQFHVGCSGWFYWHWRGSFYPEGLATKAWFARYSSQFKTVELNAPFYSWPTVGTVESWKKQIGRRRFIYTIKACELITHVKRFSGTKRLVQDFGYIADLLGTRMGCFLFQLPPSFYYSPARLRLIVDSLDPARRNVVEFRHRSWWNANVYDAFKAAGIIFCSCSGPRLPDELVKTADDIYIRFHGTKQWYRHDYTNEEMQVWVDRIVASGAKQVWAYFNNDREGHALKNARELLRLLKSRTNR